MNRASQDVLETPTVVNFGTVYVGGQSTEAITISNIGDGTLRLDGTVTGSGFALGQAVVFVPPNGDHAAAITFSPTQVGDATSTVIFQTQRLRSSFVGLASGPCPATTTMSARRTPSTPCR